MPGAVITAENAVDEAVLPDFNPTYCSAILFS